MVGDDLGSNQPAGQMHCVLWAGSIIQVTFRLDRGSTSRMACLALNTAVAGDPLSTTPRWR